MSTANHSYCRFASARRLVSLLVAVSLVSILILGCSRNEEAPRPAKSTAGSDEITIAAVAPMTGNYAEMGTDLLNAVRMAVDERNAAGGVRGKRVRLITEDDQASPKDAVAIAHKLVGNATIIGLVGHMNSGTALPASAIYHDGGMPMILPVPTNPEITRQGFDNLFRVPITDDKQGPACVKFAVENLKMRRIAVIHNKEAYGEGIATEVRKELERRELPPPVFQGVSANETDFRPVITNLKGLKPDGVFIGSGAREAALFIKQSREQGLTVPFVMGDGCFDSQLISIAGAAVDGCYISNIAPLTAPTPAAERFYQEFQKKHGKIVAFAPLGYVSANLLLDAINQSADLSRVAVLKTLRDPTFHDKSILGDISFDQHGDSRNQKVFVHTIENGRFKSVGE